jgi:hypothetical protein
MHEEVLRLASGPQQADLILAMMEKVAAAPHSSRLSRWV